MAHTSSVSSRVGTALQGMLDTSLKLKINENQSENSSIADRLGSVVKNMVTGFTK